MGVSERTARAFEPKAGDLLMPERQLQKRFQVKRDVEDASFEPVDRGDTGRSGSRTRRPPQGVFKSRLGDRPESGPYPRDFAAVDPVMVRSAGPGERLGVFTGKASVTSDGRSPARIGFSAMVGVVALMAFWMAGGHTLLLENTKGEVEVSGSVEPMRPGAAEADTALAPDPVTTSSVPYSSVQADPLAQQSGSIIHPKPRPARIERAGSILMIRPQGD